MSEAFPRRQFLKIGAATGLACATLSTLLHDSPLKKSLLSRISPPNSFPIEWLGPDVHTAHRMRNLLPELESQKELLQKNAFEKTVLILGGGVAGLSAAWWLKKNRFSDFEILELESDVGGNSRAGTSNISSFPLGAHYLPIPNAESTEVHLLLEEMGLITGHDSNQKPLFAEEHLVADPEERLFKDGLWQEGLTPKVGVTNEDQKEISRFFALMSEYKSMQGKDGRPAFAIPVSRSSQDEELKRLDQMRFSDFLSKHQFKAVPLLWLLNYSMRDDYGAGIDSVSAWARIHYFAGRRGFAGNAKDHEILTWPEGNHFLIRHYEKMLDGHLKTSCFVARIERKDETYFIYFYDLLKKTWSCCKANHLVYALPQFTAKYLFANSPALNFPVAYAPWIVTNIGLKKIPQGPGFSVAWDNVSYYSKSLGYVVATHQNTVMRPQETVITFYWPQDEQAPQMEREKLLKASAADFWPKILSELEKMHPEIAQDILFVKIWVWGHGMITPVPNYIWNQERQNFIQKFNQLYPHVHFAHTDQTGISIFEEAQYHGVEAARKILKDRKNTSFSAEKSSLFVQGKKI